MDALENILNRVSARKLAEPFPSTDEMKKVYKAALRAPDHAWLRTSSFIEVKGEGLDKLSNIFLDFGKTIPNLPDDILKKYTDAPYRAPMIIILVNTHKETSKSAVNRTETFNRGRSSKYNACIKCYELFMHLENWKNGF